MSIPEIFACEEAAIRALDRLFPELEAVPCQARGQNKRVGSLLTGELKGQVSFQRDLTLFVFWADVWITIRE